MTDSVVTPRVTPRSAGVFEDLRSIALRALRLTWRDPETFLPALVIPVFFFVVDYVSSWPVFNNPALARLNALSLDVLTLRWLRRRAARLWNGRRGG